MHDHQEPFEAEHHTHEARLDRPTQEERNWALGAHLGIFAFSLIGPLCFVVPLVIYLTQRERSEFVASEAREALNFQLTLLLFLVAGAVLTVIVVGFGVLAVAALMGIILPILAAIQASEGTPYRYPWTVRFVE